MSRIPQEIIDQAKAANLIDYMLLNHPDQIINRYGIRDRVHDSLVLYPDTFCRYSTGEVNDNIRYLTKYQGYEWRDAVFRLRRFSFSHYEKPEVPSFYSAYAKARKRFFRPIETDHTELMIDYLHHKRGISLNTINHLIHTKKVYPATAAGFGNDYVCFANDDMGFYSLRSISSEGMPKLLFTKNPNNFCYFCTRDFEKAPDLIEYLTRKENPFPAKYPLFICEAPLDAISLYDMEPEPGIYAAMGGLKPETFNRIVDYFSPPSVGGSSIHRPIFITVDNDKAGTDFCSHLYGDYCRLTPAHKDWNEDLMAYTNGRKI